MTQRFLTLIVLAMVLLIPTDLKSQDLAPFTNYRDNFYVFDDGQFIKLEHLPIRNFKVGKWAVAYQNSNGSLVVYTNGQTHKLSELVEDYQVTESLLIYYYGRNLFVYDGIDKKKLAMDSPDFKANNEIVAYYDRVNKVFRAYYDGVVYDIESALSNEPVSNYELGDNILAYLDANDYLRYFYKGNQGDIMMAKGRPVYQVDKDIIAYFDPYDGAFKVFYEGQTRQIDFFEPKSFKVADRRVAYVKNNGDFCVFQDGGEQTITTLTPNFYHVEDSLIIYEENGYLKTFYNQRSYTLENYIPASMKYEFNTLAYLDEQRHLVVFSRGHKQILSYEPVNNYEVYWGVVWYNTGVNTNKVFYNGTVH